MTTSVSHLTSHISPKDRLIFALDVPEIADARALVEQLGDSVSFYKIGMELLMTGGYFELLDWLKQRDKKVFVDLKLFDVPATVGRAIARLAQYGADFATVHGNQGIMEAAAAAKSGDLKVLAVTALTSLDQADINDLGFACNIEDLVLSRARRSLEAGCDGVVSSGLEVTRLRAECGNKLVAVTPGIRPVLNDTVNSDHGDQKRVMTPSEALRAGADYLVIGRPIRDADNPRAAAEAIQAEVQAALNE